MLASACSRTNMTIFGVIQIFVFLAIIIAVAKPIGLYMARVFSGERTFLHPVLRPVERFCYWVGGINETVEQRWTVYTGSLLSFSMASFALLYLIERAQGMLPFNPMGFGSAHPPNGATAMT